MEEGFKERQDQVEESYEITENEEDMVYGTVKITGNEE